MEILVRVSSAITTSLVMVQPQTSILDMEPTSHAPCLAMEARVVMRVLRQMLNCTSRQWKTTILAILFPPLSTICSILHTMPEQEFTQTRGVQQQPRHRGNTLQRLKPLTIVHSIMTRSATDKKDSRFCLQLEMMAQEQEQLVHHQLRRTS